MEDPRIGRSPTIALTLCAMIAFAGNSLLCRLALKATPIDAASFTSIRLISGAVTLWLIGRLRVERIQLGQTSKDGSLDEKLQRPSRGNWLSALALFTYAAGFSFAYIQLAAGTGALLLFGAVQVTMIGYGFWRGERFNLRQVTGFIIAFGGLVGLVFPGLSAPPLLNSALMLGAGIAWGVYSLRGRASRTPIPLTAGNFLRAVPFTVMLSLVASPWLSLNGLGVVCAIASGAIASGIGYTLWYIALQGLQATSAATVQLSVPVIAAIGGIIFLGESLTLRIIITSIAILGGIALSILGKNLGNTNSFKAGYRANRSKR